MIKSEKGVVSVNGNAFDVVFEFDHLIKALAEDDPDLLSSVIFKNTDIIAEAIQRCDTSKLKMLERCLDDIEALREDNNDED